MEKYLLTRWNRFDQIGRTSIACTLSARSKTIRIIEIWAVPMHRAFDFKLLPKMDAATKGVLKLVVEALRKSPNFRNQKLDLQMHDGILTVRGRLPSFYLKQVLQTELQRIDGVVVVNNCVEVVHRNDVRRRFKRPPS